MQDLPACIVSLLHAQPDLFSDWPVYAELTIEDRVKAVWSSDELVRSLDESKCYEMLLQILRLNDEYGVENGGLEGYISNARNLLKNLKVNTYEGWTASPPQNCITLPFASSSFFSYERVGSQALLDARVGFVLVAGGLGERLGLQEEDRIKLSLMSDTTSGMCFLELFLEQLSAWSPKTSLCIMTSDQTHVNTLRLLSRIQTKIEITVLKQDNVATIKDFEGRLAKSSPFSLLEKPHGHGDVHLLLHRSGVAQNWLLQGKTHVVFFQDTNPGALRCAAASVGVSIKHSFDMNFLTVPRAAKSKSGAIVSMTKEEAFATVNVEYNVLDVVLRGTTGGEDLNDPITGKSIFPGNTNQLVLALNAYCKRLASKSGRVVPEFVNPKMDRSGTAFQRPTRLETLMQDYAVGLDANLVGVTLLEDYGQNPSKNTHCLYAPAKNELKVARELSHQGAADGSLLSAELSVYAASCAMLLSIRPYAIASPEPIRIGGLENAHLWPRIVLSPSFVPFWFGLRDRIPVDARDFRVTSRSSLLVKGNVHIHHLDLDGSLVLSALHPGSRIVVKRLSCVNEGTAWAELDECTEDDWRARGFRLSERRTVRVIATEREGQMIEVDEKQN